MIFTQRPISAAILALAGIFSASTAHAGFEVTVEAPGVTNTTATFDTTGVETFDSRPVGTDENFTTNFGMAPGLIQGTYSGVDIVPSVGSNGVSPIGNYARATNDGASYTLSLTGTAPINYFGFFLGALDSGNMLTFYKAGQVVYTFSPADLIALVGTNTGYDGNPTVPGGGPHKDTDYAFVNFYDIGGTFDEIRFNQTASGSYESDNHTVGVYNTIAGTPVTPVPEPETYALMLAGLTALAVVARRRKTV
jgi:PEP-CTERM motif